MRTLTEAANAVCIKEITESKSTKPKWTVYMTMNGGEYQGDVFVNAELVKKVAKNSFDADGAIITFPGEKIISITRGW